MYQKKQLPLIINVLYCTVNNCTQRKKNIVLYRLGLKYIFKSTFF